jgi:hypothetical protein
VGYESEAAFSKAFKRWVGTAPGAYRKAARANGQSVQSESSAHASAWGGGLVLATLWDWIRGDLTPQARVITAVLPGVLALGYMLAAMVVFAIRNRTREAYGDAELLRRGATPILGMWLRQYFAWLMRPLVGALVGLRLPPNAVTTLSLLLAVGAAVAAAAGRMALGGWLFVASGLCDFLDG